VSKNIATPGAITSGTNRFLMTPGLTAKYLRITDNIYNGTTGNPILSSVPALVESHGNSWSPITTYGTAAPTTGTYRVGDKVLNTNPAEAGSALSKYMITGWSCTVAGTPGTWLENRTLTGN